MITYLNSIKDTKTLVCTAEMWERLTASPQNQEYVKLFRKTGLIDWKQRLPAVNFHGYDPKVLKGLDGSRKQADLLPTGLFMLDIDHVDNPKKYWVKLQKTLSPLTLEGGTLISSEANSTAEGIKNLPLRGIEGAALVLVHITPSGKGLRIVMQGRKDSNIKDDQAWLANILGVQHDACTKDLSRWSFIPTQSDILFINKEILFSNAQETTYNSSANSLTQGTEKVQKTPGLSSLEDSSEESSESIFPQTYHKIPYEKIVEGLIQYHGGTPELGERHHTIITLANDLKTITDGNVDWLMQIIPSFDKPLHEKRDAIVWAVQHLTQGKSRALNNVLEYLINGTPLKSEKDEDDEETEFKKNQEKKQANLDSIPKLPEHLPKLIELLTSKVMPFQKPAVASMVFPALATHVSNSIFVGVENKKYELSLMGVLVGKQSVGKGGIDDPIAEINADIAEEDEKAREKEREWHEAQQTKGANEKGMERPNMPIRLISSNTTNAALLMRFFNAERNGEQKRMRCYTKVEEIEKLFNMGITQTGKSGIHGLIKDTWDVAALDSERFGLNSANYSTVLRWNWNASCTPDKAKAFFKNVMTDGTLSRVDFAVMIAPDEDFKFRYGDYDDDFADALEPYINNLNSFKCEEGKRKRLIPFRLKELDELEEKADKYITEKKKEMVDETWVSFAWRTKFIAINNVLLVLSTLAKV